jgi:hypothetical protein
MMLAALRLAGHAVVGAAIALGGSDAVRADDDRAPARSPLPAKYRNECGACHTAYPPGLLPAASWQRLMSNLPHHFGTDASLDPATVAELASWLDANAASDRKVRKGIASPPDDRITRSAWFVREHDEVAPATWKLPAVRSPANCIACHRGADQGDFDEDLVRIPR